MWKKFIDMTEEEKLEIIEENFEKLLRTATGQTSFKKPFKQLDITGLGWERKDGEFELILRHEFDLPIPSLRDMEPYYFGKTLFLHDGEPTLVQVNEIEPLSTMENADRERMIELLIKYYKRTNKDTKIKEARMRTMMGLSGYSMRWLDEEFKTIQWSSPEEDEEVLHKIKVAVKESRKEIEKAWNDEILQKMIRDYLIQTNAPKFFQKKEN